MQKSIGSRNYAHFLTCLREAREKSGVTQEEMAARLGETQSFVSKCERGERRMDIVELREFCKAMGLTLEKFVKQLERGMH
ncbi:MAG TPA: helix-turn-helix transcriptional regulator [Acidiferrobacterales bacterium]|nr:helix-turn-helix transcriptional regulator [Acidiferrobacterales bacterium]